MKWMRNNGKESLKEQLVVGNALASLETALGAEMGYQ